MSQVEDESQLCVVGDGVLRPVGVAGVKEVYVKDADIQYYIIDGEPYWALRSPLPDGRQALYPVAHSGETTAFEAISVHAAISAAAREAEIPWFTHVDFTSLLRYFGIVWFSGYEGINLLPNKV